LFGPYEVTYWEPEEKRELKVSLPGAILAELQEAARVRFPQDLVDGKAAELQFLDAGALAVMKIRGFVEFVDTKRTQKLADFFQESFDAMHKRGTKALILDVRNNGGGEDELGKRLLSYLLDKPFKYYDELVIIAREFGFGQYAELPKIPDKAVERRPHGKYRVLIHPNLGIQQSRKPTFAGKVFILMNGHSVSTTAEFLSLAHHHHRAEFIGEEAGGAYHGNTSGVVVTVTLPNTKLIVYVPLAAYYLAVDGSKPAAHGVLPDHPVRYHVKELLECTDKELALALKLARQPVGGSK
jgi:C-terminal processing protease CtpA/Prc